MRTCAGCKKRLGLGYCRSSYGHNGVRCMYKHDRGRHLRRAYIETIIYDERRRLGMFYFTSPLPSNEKASSITPLTLSNRARTLKYIRDFGGNVHTRFSEVPNVYRYKMYALKSLGCDYFVIKRRTNPITTYFVYTIRFSSHKQSRCPYLL